MRTTSALTAAMPPQRLPRRAGAGPQPQSVARRGRAGSGRGAAASAAVAAQRRGYATAVLRGLARSLRGRPTSEVERTLTQALRPLGVRLSPPARRELATAITHGQPVTLP